MVSSVCVPTAATGPLFVVCVAVSVVAGVLAEFSSSFSAVSNVTGLTGVTGSVFIAATAVEGGEAETAGVTGVVEDFCVDAVVSAIVGEL